MNWYLIKMVFNINVGEQVSNPQFDEQVRLIEARNEEEAFIKARMIGVREEDSFENDSQNGVAWKFIDISELTLIKEFTDGMEICSKISEHDYPEGYINFIYQKAKQIEQRLSLNVVA